MDPSLNLPPEVWTRIFLFACTIPEAFSPHPRSKSGIIESEHREDWWRLQNEVSSCRYTYRCISLVCRSWYHFSLPFFWHHLVLHSPATVIGAANALSASRTISHHYSHHQRLHLQETQNIPYHESSSMPQPTGGMGWFVRRIDLDLPVSKPSMELSEQLLRGLATILTLCPNLQIFSDHAHPGPAFDDQFVIYLPDALLSYLFRPNNQLKRVDWSANNLVPFCSYLHSAPQLESLSLHHFVPNPITWLPINQPGGVCLPNLQTLVMNEDPARGQAAIVSTWDLPRLHMLRLEISPILGSDFFLRINGHKIKTLSIHTPAMINVPLHSIAQYCSYMPNLESLYFQLHHPSFTQTTTALVALAGQGGPTPVAPGGVPPLPSLKMIGIHGLLNFRGRSFDDGEDEQLHRHLTAMVRSRGRMPSLKIIRLVDFDPESWTSQGRTAREVARWQRWQLRWEMLGVRWEDKDGQLMRVPNALLELLEQKDLDDEEIYSDDEMAVDEELEGFSDYLSLSSASGLWD
ncbi:hypothetical protein CPB86DRAFT_697551 [Serendipita vermifera]|nr:hypothetical protein CPB86DRAFT_697551 [Serendipita vermifera]